MIAKLLVIATIAFNFSSLAQEDSITSRQLETSEISEIFSKPIKDTLGIQFEIYRVYTFIDGAGEHYILMTENRKGSGENEFDAVRAYCFSKEGQTWDLEWQFWDFILTEGNEVGSETSINHWTKYFELKDFDNDGLVDPILIYGTFDDGNCEDGRIKILTYYKSEKHAIRHQNGSLDFLRKTKVDESFYELPQEIQERVHQIMRDLTNNDHAIFPYGWQEAMKNKKSYFDEN